MRIFLDTNVLVSAVATRGLCADVLREVLVSHQLLISSPLLMELKNALHTKLRVPDEIIAELLEMLQQDSDVSTSSPLVDIDIKDKDDLIILSCAMNGGADLFITGDRELLEMKRVGNMEIVSPRMFWVKLKAQPPDEP